MALYLPRVRSSEVFGGDRHPRPRQLLQTDVRLPTRVKPVAPQTSQSVRGLWTSRRRDRPAASASRNATSQKTPAKNAKPKALGTRNPLSPLPSGSPVAKYAMRSGISINQNAIPFSMSIGPIKLNQNATATTPVTQVAVSADLRKRSMSRLTVELSGAHAEV